MIKKWKSLESNVPYESGLFKLRIDKCELPDGRVMPRYYIFEFPDWTNILPLTPDGKVIMVEQYRHATGDIHLEIPGGSLSPNLKEDPQEAAERELLEETGYKGKRVELIGTHQPNPAIQNNRMHTYIAYDCEKISDVKFDPFEDLRTVYISKDELINKIMTGEIHHTIVVASVLMALKHLGYELNLAKSD